MTDQALRAITDDELRAAAILVVPWALVSDDGAIADLLEALNRRAETAGYTRPLVLALHDPGELKLAIDDREVAADLVAYLRGRFDL